MPTFLHIGSQFRMFFFCFLVGPPPGRGAGAGGAGVLLLICALVGSEAGAWVLELGARGELGSDSCSCLCWWLAGGGGRWGVRGSSLDAVSAARASDFEVEEGGGGGSFESRISSKPIFNSCVILRSRVLRGVRSGMSS